jgi:hypothetical protein
MNPASFINTYWLVESIKVYQEVAGAYPAESSTEIFNLQTQPASA